MTTETIKFRYENRRKKRLREITTHIVLLLLVFMYSYMGALLFQSIEEKHEQRAKGNLIKSKHNFLDLIQLGHGSPMVDERNWTRMVDKLLNYYVEDLAEATSHGVDITDVTQHEYESASKWDFWGSLFYAGTVYTTIGYGNFAPVTSEGKIATIIYGTIGIPLCLILLADLGHLIAKLIKYSVKKVKKLWYATSKKNVRALWPPQDEIDSMAGRSSLVVLGIVSITYFTFGAFMYKSWEDDWSYLDAVYFIFVSTSTIGFGDVLPNHPKKFIFTSLYIFFGLSLLSCGFTIIQDLLEGRISDAKMDLDNALGIKKSEATEKTTSSSTETLASTSDSSTSHQRLIPSEPETIVASKSEPLLESTPQPTLEPELKAKPELSVQDAISELIAVEECVTQQSVNNNNLESAPPAKYQVPIQSEPPSDSFHEHSRRRNSANLRVSETRLISLDDGVLSVEATIILD